MFEFHKRYVIIHRPNGKLARSRNLRGIVDYARKHGVAKVVIDTHRSTGQAYMRITFVDGATCETDFADYRVMRNWVKSRRSWRGCEVLDLLPIEKCNS